MTFTALHRVAGAAPGPLTNDVLDAAVAAHAEETDDLDWKSQTLPPTKDLQRHDFRKDVAAMANSGGGVIVYGVAEVQKAATIRVDVGELTEAHERTLRSAAVNLITPPVFGLVFHRLESDGKHAVVVEVPASVDVPHLIYRDEYFGAPVRNNADTVWMRERQIEVMYRARFEERRHATEALDALYGEAAAGRDVTKRAWLIAVAHPRIPRVGVRLNRDEARSVLSRAEKLALVYAGRGWIHPLESVDLLNPRPGLRRWVAMNKATGEHSRWKESWVSIHHDGSVTLATAVGGHRRDSNEYYEGWQLMSLAVECAVADLMALVRATAGATGGGEYEVRVGVDWSGEEPLVMFTKDGFGFVERDWSVPLPRWSPVDESVDAAGSDADFYWRVHDLAMDCVNQCGVPNVVMINPPPRDEQVSPA